MTGLLAGDAKLILTQFLQMLQGGLLLDDRPGERLAKRITLVGGCVAGLMLGFSGFMWSQAVIVEVYTLSVLSLMGVLCCLYRWTQDTARMRYLYWTFFWFGICLCNHQTLIVAAMGIETVILFAHPRLGRNFFTVNALVYLLVLVAMATGATELFSGNAPMQVLFHMLGVSFIAVAGLMWLVTLCLLYTSDAADE